MTAAEVKAWLEIIEMVLKSLAVVGAGIWAVAIFRLLRQRELAQAGLRKIEAEIRDFDLKAKTSEAQMRDFDLKAKTAEAQIRDFDLKAKSAEAQMRDFDLKAKSAEAQMRDLDISAKHKEAEIRDLDLKCKQQAVMRVDIQPAVHRDVEGTGYFILTTVDLTNRGNRNTRIKWQDHPPAFYVRQAQFDAEGTLEFDDVVQEFRVPLTLQPDQESVSHTIRAGGTESIPFAVRVATPGLYLLSFRGIVDEEERKVSQETGANYPVAWTGNKYVLVGK